MELQIQSNKLKHNINYTFEYKKVYCFRNICIINGRFKMYLNNNGIANSGISIYNYSENNSEIKNGILCGPLDWIESVSLIVIPQLPGDINYYIHQFL